MIFLNFLICLRKEFTFNNIKQGNRNPLLYSYQFSDGLKTGYTEASGFSAATAENQGKAIAVLSGMDSVKEKKVKLLNYLNKLEYININLSMQMRLSVKLMSG